MATHRAKTHAALVLALATLATGSTGCQSSKADRDAPRTTMTAGMVEMSVVKGQTTQTEVLEIFGPPDVLTSSDGMEVWTYDKTVYDIEESSGYFTVLLAGSGKDTRRTASRSTMVMIYFDENEVVRDYRLSVVRY